MYTSFYKLAGRPFKLSPDYRFYFDGEPHRRAIAYLTYGLSQGDGFVVITGEVGAGKTTLIDYLLTRLQGNNVITAKISTTQIEGDNLLRLVAENFNIAQLGIDKATILRRLEAFLLDENKRQRRPLLIIDEVQNLPHSALEELRMLSNFQFDGGALLQTFLVGQPEFRHTLASPDLEQLRQRVVTTYHLQGLDADETAAYIRHRLVQVGWRDDPALAPDTFEQIYRATGGIPRRINLMCDRLLLFGYLEQLHALDGSAVDAVVADMRAEGLYGPGPVALQPLAEPAEPSSVPPPPPPPPLVEPAALSDAARLEIDGLSQRLCEFEDRLERQRTRINDVLEDIGSDPATVVS